ncbi:MAG TPA: response regulator [Vicinamibacterales bacterium]
MHTLLLADDSITIQRVIALTFAAEPIRVVSVSDGVEAMERITAERPDVIVAATTLSQVSGYDLARFIRSRPDLQGVPVLLLSGAFETVDEAKLATSGANGVIEKPVEPLAVIARVKELLGLKSDAKPASMGRLVTSADGPADNKLPPAAPPRPVTSTKSMESDWDQLRKQSGLDADTRSVEDPAVRADQYLDKLDVAFDSLDQQLSGRAPKTARRSPGQSGDADDSRSRGHQAGNDALSASVFEVDDAWFASTESDTQAAARAGRQEILDDLRSPELQMPAAPESVAGPVFEVDDQWFADGNKERAAKLEQQRQLVAEMGIHDVGLADVAPASPVETQTEPADVSEPVSAAEPVSSVEPVMVAEPAVVEPGADPAPPSALAPAAEAHGVADDFAALLAYEQGESVAPSLASRPALVSAPAAPEVTDAMLDDIAARVAERLTASAFGEELRAAITDTLRETVRNVVSETAERLVRDEIDRIKNKN